MDGATNKYMNVTRVAGINTLSGIIPYLRSVKNITIKEEIINK